MLLSPREQQRASAVTDVTIARVAVRIEQPGTTARAATPFEPRVEGISEAGVIAAPGLIERADRLDSFGFA